MPLHVKLQLYVSFNMAKWCGDCGHVARWPITSWREERRLRHTSPVALRHSSTVERRPSGLLQ